MKVTKVKVENFASYKSLELDLSNKGLCLVSGPTGSGKSTLCDIIPWILFGRTSKGGTVDEVRTWNTDENTTGAAEVTVKDQQISIFRSRGRTNDLYYETESGIIRGKDLLDTQKQINNILGVDLDLYLCGAYFHEFSQLASFFTATAKNRRQLTEQLVDLSFPSKLAESVTINKKEANKELEQVENTLTTKSQLLETASNKIMSLSVKSEKWQITRDVELEMLKIKSDNFEKDKLTSLEEMYEAYYREEIDLKSEMKDLQNKIVPDEEFEVKKLKITKTIDSLPSEVCPTCGSKSSSDQRLLLSHNLYALSQNRNKNQQLLIDLKKLEQILAKHQSPTSYSMRNIEQEMSRENTYIAEIERLETQVNPYFELIREEEATKEKIKEGLGKFLSEKHAKLTDISDLEVLSSIINDLRKHLVKNTIMSIESKTNKFLEDHFDGEIKVEFEIKDADKLETQVYKDGNVCSYTQLSKGQRQLLKLCFAVSVMNTIHDKYLNFNVIFLDEALDGLDEDFKIKTYALLEELATKHESVLVVEHNTAFKALFTNKYEVALVNGESKIAQT